MAMMIPDYALVAEVMLFSEGFGDAKSLSRKMVQLYKLASEQLSQQVRTINQFDVFILFYVLFPSLEWLWWRQAAPRKMVQLYKLASEQLSQQVRTFHQFDVFIQLFTLFWIFPCFGFYFGF